MNSPSSNPTQILADWKAWPTPHCQISNAVGQPGQDGWLVVRPEPGPGRAGLVLQPEQGTWDLSTFAEIAVPVRNLTAQDVRAVLGVNDDPVEAVIAPGPEPVWLVVPLGDKQPSLLADRFISMTGQPVDFVRRGLVNGANVATVAVFLPEPSCGAIVAVGPVVARGVPAPLREWPAERVFPLLDEFGQFRHRDWPGKIHSAGDFADRRQQEEADHAARARPADWNPFGGWNAGPQLPATGFFRVEKLDGVWWLVDPAGRLFWSHGVVRVGTRIRVGGIYHGTPLPDREHLLRLPSKDSPMGAFHGTEPQSTRGYYLGRDNHAVYDFLEANLFRKYGATWLADYAAQAHRRLASWGLNTIANSSDPAVYLRRQTPYTAIVYSAPLGRAEHRLAGSGGDWGKLPDPFDAGWRRLMDQVLQTELRESLHDPWCLGFFVDNELNWGDSCHLAVVTLGAPPDQPARQVFVGELQKKYGAIERLNAAWATRFTTWGAVSAPPDRVRAQVRADLEAFSERYVDAYFRGCREAVKAASPHHLYLGCRFAGGGNAVVMGVAARYCDVVSMNLYRRTIGEIALPAGLDRPIVVGEFHFAALDGPLHPAGLVLVANRADQACAYRTYVASALRNPAVIGTHWFQFYDQPPTGRFDGENYQVGLLDTCDTPYREIVNACRAMGATMYPIRCAIAQKETLRP